MNIQISPDSDTIRLLYLNEYFENNLMIYGELQTNGQGSGILVWIGENLTQVSDLNQLQSQDKIQYYKDFDAQHIPGTLPVTQFQFFKNERDIIGVGAINQADEFILVKIKNGTLTFYKYLDKSDNKPFINKLQGSQGPGVCTGMAQISFQVPQREREKTLILADSEETFTTPPIILFESIDGTISAYEIYNLEWAQNNLMRETVSIPQRQEEMKSNNPFHVQQQPQNSQAQFQPERISQPNINLVQNNNNFGQSQLRPSQNQIHQADSKIQNQKQKQEADQIQQNFQSNQNELKQQAQQLKQDEMKVSGEKERVERDTKIIFKQYIENINKFYNEQVIKKFNSSLNNLSSKQDNQVQQIKAQIKNLSERNEINQHIIQIQKFINQKKIYEKESQNLKIYLSNFKNDLQNTELKEKMEEIDEDFFKFIEASKGYLMEDKVFMQDRYNEVDKLNQKCEYLMKRSSTNIQIEQYSSDKQKEALVSTNKLLVSKQQKAKKNRNLQLPGNEEMLNPQDKNGLISNINQSFNKNAQSIPEGINTVYDSLGEQIYSKIIKIKSKQVQVDDTQSQSHQQSQSQQSMVQSFISSEQKLNILQIKKRSFQSQKILVQNETKPSIYQTELMNFLVEKEPQQQKINQNQNNRKSQNSIQSSINLEVAIGNNQQKVEQIKLQQDQQKKQQRDQIIQQQSQFPQKKTQPFQQQEELKTQSEISEAKLQTFLTSIKGTDSNDMFSKEEDFKDIDRKILGEQKQVPKTNNQITGFSNLLSNSGTSNSVKDNQPKISGLMNLNQVPDQKKSDLPAFMQKKEEVKIAKTDNQEELKQKQQEEIKKKEETKKKEEQEKLKQEKLKEEEAKKEQKPQQQPVTNLFNQNLNSSSQKQGEQPQANIFGGPSSGGGMFSSLQNSITKISTQQQQHFGGFGGQPMQQQAFGSNQLQQTQTFGTIDAASIARMQQDKSKENTQPQRIFGQDSNQMGSGFGSKNISQPPSFSTIQPSQQPPSFLNNAGGGGMFNQQQQQQQQPSWLNNPQPANNMFQGVNAFQAQNQQVSYDEDDSGFGNFAPNPQVNQFGVNNGGGFMGQGGGGGIFGGQPLNLGFNPVPAPSNINPALLKARK